MRRVRASDTRRSPRVGAGGYRASCAHKWRMLHSAAYCPSRRPPCSLLTNHSTAAVDAPSAPSALRSPPAASMCSVAAVCLDAASPVAASATSGAIPPDETRAAWLPTSSQRL
eukprot:scaffold25461_cov50-Phaeocystis_antarctica.AAC.2